MRILITGGAGYIGSHTLLEVLAAGHDALVVDSFRGASPEALERVRHLSGRDFAVMSLDIRATEALAAAVDGFRPDAVIHFAGLKAVGESFRIPLEYFDVNVTGALSLLRVLESTGCRRFVFSSSATVYGHPDYLPVDEMHPRRAISPYGRSKLHIEEILEDLAAGDGQWCIALLRYFNPVGAHPSGSIGEDPAGIPNNLMPIIAQVAVGRRERLNVWGGDYDTPDGTCIRDYIHVTDLAKAHVAAVNWTSRASGCEALNIGTGSGRSVLEMVAAFRSASGQPIPLTMSDRRQGDAPVLYADPSKARRLLGWQASLGLDDMCASTWTWQSRNPFGYQRGLVATGAGN